MLYNKNWDKPEVKADPLTMESFIEWLEKKPAAETYDYENCKGQCLYGQYMAAHGVAFWKSGAGSSHDSGPERAAFCVLIYQDVACEKPWTFGAALDRARKALAERDL